MSKTSRTLPFIATTALSVATGYVLGKNDSTLKFAQPSYWQNLPIQTSSDIMLAGLRAGALKNTPLDKSLARDIAGQALDRSEISHGDTAIPSSAVHSARFIITQWQRSAVGACVVVLGKDKDGDLCVALGSQRGELVIPQGYMEVPAPRDDGTGVLHSNNASRFNKKTGEIITADQTIEDNAIREVKEEIGVDLKKDQLKLLSVDSATDKRLGLYMVAAIYGAKLSSTPDLKVLDDEFVDDDIKQPFWSKVRDIKMLGDNFYVKNGNSNNPINSECISHIKNAVTSIASEQEKIGIDLLKSKISKNYTEQQR